MINSRNNYFSLILIFFIISIVFYFLFRIDFSDFLFPFSDSYDTADGKMTIAYIKMVISEDWLGLLSPNTLYLSAPFKFEIYDYPLPFLSNFVFIKFLSIFSSDSIVVFNLYYISTYFLNAFTMYWVLRRLRVNWYLTISIALLFTFLPWHYLRLIHTLFTGYFFIPLWIYYLLLLTNKKPLFFKRKVGESKYSFDWSKRNIVIILVLLVSSTWNFYYTFFFSFLIGFTLLSNLVYRNSKHHILSTLLFLSLAVAPFAGNMIPYKAYEIENGKNYQVGQRHPIESEIFGLKIAHMLIPAEGHRIKEFDSLSDSYHKTNDIIYEGTPDTEGSYLGVFGSIGFLLLFLTLIFNKFASRALLRLSQFNISLLLLSTIGGFSSIIAFTITTQIRAYNRVSIFIATLSLIALSIVINRYIDKKFKSKTIFLGVSLLILAVGIFDQIPKTYQLVGNQLSRTEYLSDKNFIQNIESRFDVDNDKIMIAQYPFIAYPESGEFNNMKDYEHVQGYLHSDKLYWSFGAMKGREADSWWKDLQNKSIEEQIQILQDSGFSGIMINRNGYHDNAESLENSIFQFLELRPMVSENKILSFYRLSPTGSEVLMPEIMFNSFYDWEGEPGKFRWAGEGANIVLHNNNDIIVMRDISFVLGTLRNRGMEIKLNDKVLESFEIKSGENTQHTFNLKLNPGKNKLEFETRESAVKPGGADGRSLLFSFSDLRLITNDS
jgi:hypothetical protein